MLIVQVKIFGEIPAVHILRFIMLFRSIKLLGVNSDIPESMPPLNKQVISGKVAFHIRDGVHNMLLKDWNWFMDFADVVLK